MVEPVEVVRRNARQRRLVTRRKPREAAGKVVDGGDDLRDPLRWRGGPCRRLEDEGEQREAEIEAELERAAAVRPAVVRVRRRQRGHDRHEMWRTRHRREPLRHTDIRDAVHPHPAVRPRLRRTPLDRVVSVLDLVPEEVKLPIRAPAAARVLDNHGIAGAGETQRIDHQPDGRERLVVRRALQQHRVATLGLRQIDVRREDGAVARRSRNVPLKRDAEPFGGEIADGQTTGTTSCDGCS